MVGSKKKILGCFVLASLLFSNFAFSAEKNPSTQKNKRKQKVDFWNHTQDMRHQLFQEDIVDTTRYSNPLIRQVPTLMSENVPCSLRPAAGAGLKTNCKF